MNDTRNDIKGLRWYSKLIKWNVILYRVKNVLSTELAKRFIIHELYIKETSKQTLYIPQITILFVSSQYKTPELLPEI